MINASTDKVVAVMARLHDDNPQAFDDFVDWCSLPRHTKQITLRFHGGKLQVAEFSTTSK